MEFWQSIKGKWNQLVQWKLWNVAGTPSNAPESALWYDTTEHRAALKDDEKTRHLAHVEDLPNYSGVFTLPTITVGAGGVLTIGGDGYIYAREDANYTGIPKLWNPAGATLNLVSGADQWLVYTAGVGYSLTTINPGDAGLLSNKVPLYRYQYEFGRVHSEDQDQLARGQSEKNAVRVAFTEFYKRVRETGLELTMSNLLVNISGAYVYRGPVIDSVVPFVGGTNQLYRHSIANGTWSEATVAGIDTSIYNPSTGIATLQAQKFAWAHVYRSIGDAVEAFVVYGDSDYSTEAAAIAGFKIPSALTATIRSHCVRVASVLYKKGDTTIPSTRVYTAWVESTIGSTGIPNHNELGLIDGGDPANNYYGHLSAAQRLLIVNSGAANGVATLDANGKVPSGQLPSYVDDVLEYATKAGFPATGESGKIYVDLSTNLTWRWSGSTYVEISPSLALGETSTTAYRGDRGKIAYDHSKAAHAPANADNTQAAIAAAAAKTTPVDADVLPLLDSAASWAVKKLSWANIKAALKAYLDTLYSAIGHTHAASTITSTATGDVAATNVQAAIAELASEKLSNSAAASTYATIQQLSDKISKTDTNIQNITGPIKLNKSIYNHTNNGVAGTSGYFKVCTINIISAYVNRPLEMSIAQRQKVSSCRLSITFQSISVLDPTLSAFRYSGGDSIVAYIQNSATSVWDLYVNKQEPYDNLQVFDFNDPHNNFNVVWSTATEQVTSLPAGGTFAIPHTLKMSNTASDIPSTATGDVAATNVQAAIDELANEKLAASAAATEYVSKTATGTQAMASGLNGPSIFSIGIDTIPGSDSGRLDLFGAGAASTSRGAGIQIQGKDSGGTDAGGGIYYDAANITAAAAAHFFRVKGITKFTVTNSGASQAGIIDVLGGTDNTPLTGNVQTLLNGKSPVNATIADNAGSSTLPTAGTATAIVTLLQQIRDNLKKLFASLTDGSVTKIGTATVGSNVRPVYLNAGSPTQVSANIALAVHAHGNLTSDGKLGATAGLPVVTGTGGAVQAVAWSTTNPNMDGTASVGSSTVPSRSDHRHPSDTSRATRAKDSVAALYSGVTMSSVVDGTTYTLPQYGTATLPANVGSIGDRVFFTVTGCNAGPITVNGLQKNGGQGVSGIIAEKCALGWCVC